MSLGTQQSYRERILRVLVHIQAHLDEPISLPDLAAVAHFSPYHFHRIFRAMVGESVMEHVRRLRLERAAHRLRVGDEPVVQVAYEAGYESHEAFTRAFSAMFGLAPSRYRASRRAPEPTAAPSPWSGPLTAGERRGEPGDPSGLGPARRAGEPYRRAGEPDKGAPAMDVRFEKLPPIRAVFIRHLGPYDEVGETFDRVIAWAGGRGLIGPDTLFFGMCHDDPDVTPTDKLRYDACISVASPVKPEGDVGIQEIPGREYAVVTHQGPYEELPKVYQWLCGQWPPTSGREPSAAPCLEIYRNDPKSTLPEKLVTDVCLPLEPR